MTSIPLVHSMVCWDSAGCLPCLTTSDNLSHITENTMAVHWLLIHAFTFGMARRRPSRLLTLLNCLFFTLVLTTHATNMLHWQLWVG